jgi:hypothetical protein
MSTRKMHGAMNGMERKLVGGNGWEDERDKMSTRTMHEAMNGMRRIWMGEDECDGATDEKK